VLVPGALEQIKLVTGYNESQTYNLERRVVIEKATEEDNGHYVLLTGIFNNGQVRFLDPSFNYPRYINRRIIQMRWWDINITIESRLIFLIAEKGDTFPSYLGMVNLSY
jgi:hypothetical protein